MLVNLGVTDGEISHYLIDYRQVPERKLAAQRRPIFYREIRHSDVLDPLHGRSSLMLKSENLQKRAHRPEPSALKIHYPIGPGPKNRIFAMTERKYLHVAQERFTNAVA